jgi:hypothetical protein
MVYQGQVHWPVGLQQELLFKKVYNANNGVNVTKKFFCTDYMEK